MLVKYLFGFGVFTGATISFAVCCIYYECIISKLNKRKWVKK